MSSFIFNIGIVIRGCGVLASGKRPLAESTLVPPVCVEEWAR